MQLAFPGRKTGPPEACGKISGSAAGSLGVPRIGFGNPMPPTAAAPRANDRLQAAITDRYTLLRELGRGGMATVYLAQDRKHDRPVAVKVLHPELGSVLGGERFQREIRLAAQLQHPNILPVYDSGAGENILWFTMPYVEGDTLRRRLRRTGPFPIDEAVSVMLDLARALGYAHRRGVIHRDVKPENVMVGDDCVILADFGVARPLEAGLDPQLTVAGVIVGTPAYMSPEQVSAEGSIDHRADLYALGVLGYELLTGATPFAGLELAQMLVAHAIRDPEPIAARRPDVPAALADLVARCLRKDPADRWSSAEALAQALRTITSAATAVTAVSAVSATADSHDAPLEDLHAARAAYERRKWREAYVRFNAASATSALEAEDLERLAESAWWVAEGAACTRSREQAYRAYLQRGEIVAAASVALALAEEHFHRLARSVAQGWLRRAEEHLAGQPESAAHGWLIRLRLLVALELRRDYQAAMACADQVLALARRIGDADLEALAIQDRGRILGRTGTGAGGHGAHRRGDDVRHRGRADPAHRRPHLLQHDQHLRAAGRLRPRRRMARRGAPVDRAALRLGVPRHLPGAPRGTAAAPRLAAGSRGHGAPRGGGAGRVPPRCRGRGVLRAGVDPAADG